jgi:MscS family membrane protein
MWDQVYHGNSLREWGTSLLFILGALLLNKLIVLLNRKVISRLTKKSDTNLDDIFFIALEKPILLGVILLAFWLAASRLQLNQEIRDLISKSYDALVVLNITWFFARFISGLIEEEAPENGNNANRSRFRIDARLYPIIKRTVLIIICLIGIVMALNNVGVQVATLLSTLGIGGIAFALAAQDTIKNIFGGITIFTDKPFRIGDVINVDSVEGTVLDIGLRSTRILNYDRRILTVPNFKLMDSFITNVSSESGRRIVMELNLAYNTSSEKMQEAMRILNDIPNRIPQITDKDLVVSFTNISNSAFTLTFIYFIPKSENTNETRSLVNMEILHSFHQAGLTFAVPMSTIMIND